MKIAAKKGTSESPPASLCVAERAFQVIPPCEVSPAAASHAAPGLSAKLVNLPGVTIDTILTKEQFSLLIRHMMSGNPASHFLVVHRDDEQGVAKYAKAGWGKRFDAHASWVWDTIIGKAKLKTGMGCYSKNGDNQSTFGALDFDAHSGNHELALGYAIRAFTLTLEYKDRYVILSASGRGYHVFIFAREPRPVTEWTGMLKDVTDSIPVQIKDGECEAFPPEGTEKHKVGKAIRVPGSYNPSTDKPGLILGHNIEPLIDFLRNGKSGQIRQKNATLISEANSPSILIRDREAHNYFNCTDEGFNDEKEEKGSLKYKLARFPSKIVATEFLSPSTEREIEKVLGKHPIERKGTRHAVLRRLTGELFHKFGRQLSELIVRAHYDRHKPNIDEKTGLAEHLREFNRLWDSIRENTLANFSQSERAIYDQLNASSHQQEGFFIIRSFADYAEGRDFPIAQLSLADRLSITQPGAKWVIDRFAFVGAITKTSDAQPNRRPALYRWICRETVH